MAESHPIVIEGNQPSNSKKDSNAMQVNLRKTFNVINNPKNNQAASNNISHFATINGEVGSNNANGKNLNQSVIIMSDSKQAKGGGRNANGLNDSIVIMGNQTNSNNKKEGRKSI